MLITLVGMTAAVLTTISFLPQAIKVYKTHSTHDISLGMFIIFCLGVFLWLVYGLMVVDWPIIIANSLTLILAVSILVAKKRYG